MKFFVSFDAGQLKNSVYAQNETFNILYITKKYKFIP